MTPRVSNFQPAAVSPARCTRNVTHRSVLSSHIQQEQVAVEPVEVAASQYTFESRRHGTALVQ